MPRSHSHELFLLLLLTASKHSDTPDAELTDAAKPLHEILPEHEKGSILLQPDRKKHTSGHMQMDTRTPETPPSVLSINLLLLLSIHLSSIQDDITCAPRLFAGNQSGYLVAVYFFHCVGYFCTTVLPLLNPYRAERFCGPNRATPRPNIAGCRPRCLEPPWPIWQGLLLPILFDCKARLPTRKAPTCPPTCGPDWL